MMKAETVTAELVTAAAARHCIHADVIAATKKKYAYPWWESDDPYVIFERQLHEHVLLVPFARLLEAASLVLGRDVTAWEFTDTAPLIEEWNELKGRAS